MTNGIVRFGVAVCGLMLLGGLAFGSAANAEPPPSLGSGHISDRADVLNEAEESLLEQKLEELASSDGRPELFVVLVPDFDDPTNALAWADETAQLNNLGSGQYLLAIATDGRSLAISAEYGGDGVAAGPLSESRILDIEDQLGSDYLADNDWAGGIGYVADEFAKVPWPWWVWALILAGFALVIFAVTRLVLFVRRRSALAAELRTLEGQKKRAAQRLVQADEAVRTSEQELGFVTAEFGEETTAEFAAVLAENRTQLNEGFRILEKLQDAEADAPSQTRSWTDDIFRLCTEVDARLEDRKKEIAKLRAITDGAADHLARLRSARADATRLQSQTAERLESLAAAFPAADLVGIAGNADEISSRLTVADEHLDALQKAVAGKKPRAITQTVHEIERLLAEANDLHDAVDAQADALAARQVQPSPPVTDSSETYSENGSRLDQAVAAVEAAEKSVQARPGEAGTFALLRLSAAHRQLVVAKEATGDDARDLAADAALALAQQVQTAIAAPPAPERGRFTRPTGRASNEAIMYDSRDAGDPSPRSYSAADDDEGRGGKALLGGISGGALGLFGSASVADGELGVVVLFAIGGLVVGALASAFGGEGGGGGSSSGWGGSSGSSRRRSSGGHSSRRSRSSSSGRSSRGGSRSSGRRGGRRF